MFKRRAHLFAFVHPVFWPWLWFRLWRLEAWIRTAQRDVLFKVDRFGNLYITRISDAPRDPALYTYTAPPMPAWAAPALASDMPENVLLASLPARPECNTPRQPAVPLHALSFLDTS